MQSNKFFIATEEVSDFLQKYYSSEITDLTELHAGKHSHAFSYSHQEQEYVIRFNISDHGFLKDKYAYENFSTTEICIPKILDIGSYKDESYFCISEKLDGETVRQQYNREEYSSIHMQYDMIEAIAKVQVGGTRYGEMDEEGNAPFGSSLEYIDAVYRSHTFFNWQAIFALPFVDKTFTDYVAERMEYYAKFGTHEQELMHGDFGNENVFIKDGNITGIIDWEKSRYGDHFLDVGRVLLYCPDRKATAKAALSFYQSKDIANWKERIAMGVYHVMLTNYANAALAGNEVSCAKSKKRLEELENYLLLKDPPN